MAAAADPPGGEEVEALAPCLVGCSLLEAQVVHCLQQLVLLGLGLELPGWDLVLLAGQ